MARIILTKVATSKHIHFAALSGRGSVTPDGCVRSVNRFPTGLSAVNLLQNSGEIAIENCIATCDARMYAKGGVGYNICCARFTCLFDEYSSIH